MPPTPITLASPIATDEEIINAIKEINTIRAAELVWDSTETHLTEVHLVGTHGRKAKAVVRDVETLLKVVFKLTIDYRMISLVQIGQPITPAPARLPLSNDLDGKVIDLSDLWVWDGKLYAGKPQTRGSSCYGPLLSEEEVA